jgi:hypothetical protein
MSTAWSRLFRRLALRAIEMDWSAIHSRFALTNLHRRNNLPHIGCHRMKSKQQVDPFLIDLLLKNVDLFISPRTLISMERSLVINNT